METRGDTAMAIAASRPRMLFVRPLISQLRRAPIIPLLILLAVVFCAVFAPMIAPYTPDSFSISKKLRPPVWQEGGSLEHIFGTDHMGRDMLSRLIYGSRIALLVAILVIATAGSIGLLVAMVSGYFLLTREYKRFCKEIYNDDKNGFPSWATFLMAIMVLLICIFGLNML